MNLSIDTIFTLEQNLDVQMALRAATALDIEIEDEYEGESNDEHLFDAFELFKACLAHNRNIDSIKLTAYSTGASLDLLIKHCFSALESISVPIKNLHLKLTSQAFDETLAAPEQTMINVLRNAPAFQQLDTLVLENYYIEEAADIGFWCDFFVDIFVAVSNKSKLNALTLLCPGLELFNQQIESTEDIQAGSNFVCERFIEKIEECTGLKQLDIEGNWIPDSVWRRLGLFIQAHQSLRHVSLNAQMATKTFDFVIAALKNERLADIALMLTCSTGSVEPSAIRSLEIISNQLQRLVGLFKLRLDIDFDALPDVCITKLLNAAIKNPTLSVLDIDFHAPHFAVETINESVSMNVSLTSVTHPYPASSLFADSFARLTERNLARQAQLMPLFHFPSSHDVPEVIPAYSLSQLISAHTVWLSLMSSYALRKPDNLILFRFNHDFFTKTLYQFFTLGPCLMYVDPCRVMAQYLTIADITNLSRVTGGYFFSTRRPLVIQPAASAGLVDDSDFDPDLEIDVLLGAAADCDCDHQDKRPKMG